MKKLKLKALELGSDEVLTRAQLKNVLGGTGSGDDNCWCYHRDAEQPDPYGKWASCTRSQSISQCCGGNYDAMNCTYN